ncbi:Tyrosine recombinase XerC [Sporomusa acidovorans DSM 3132]|uniref:Tyrosine recombinase XerC n=1 Tax=Sporomusa acidovorans (strain ATCC 49682 / DSM 3132 / Mol) TaxID=1123286 RepID=A0ABZ3J4L0_SPOA4|nr:tyrosine recombinase XerC [Sporomusa acidovorans DSM 3132]SDF06501.1 Phage integrase family protein [Sporomusa acidovorans]
MKKGTVVKNIQSDINPFSLALEFTYYKEAQQVTSMTITSFKHTLNHFFAEYKGNIQDAKKLQRAVLMFLGGKSNEYYNKQLQALRQFFEYCIGEGVIQENPCNGLKYKRHSVRMVEHSQETIEDLLSIPDKSLFVGLRDYTAMLVMLDNGIRPNELLQITIDDIDFSNSQIIVREAVSKTNTLRILPLSPNVIA